MSYIYVVGIAQSGGCLLTNDKYYTDRELAMGIVKEYHDKDMKYIKLFTLYQVTQDKNTDEIEEEDNEGGRETY